MKKYSAKLETILSIGLTDVDMLISKNLAHHFEHERLRVCILFCKLVNFKIHDSFGFTHIVLNYLRYIALSKYPVDSLNF